MNSLRKSLSDYDRSTAFDLYTNGMNPIELDSSKKSPNLKYSTQISNHVKLII